MHSEGSNAPSRRFRFLWWLPVACLVVIGCFGFVYQGYREDGDSPSLQTWPIGVVSLILAAVLAWTAIRRRPSGPLHLWLVWLAMAVYLIWILYGLL